VVYLTKLPPVGEDRFGDIVISEGNKQPLWSVKDAGTVNVPPAVFNRIKNDFEDIDLWLTRVLSNMVGPQVEHSRDVINRLRSDMTRLGRQNTLPQAYLYSLQALKDVNNVSVITEFKRVDDEMRPRMDVVQIKLWRLWSECMNKALKKAMSTQKAKASGL